jgi:CheY-like chemotaxis protein
MLRARTPDNPFHILLTDARLPGTDGNNVVLMLASAGSNEQGVAACVSKPVRRKELRAALQAALNGRPLTASLTSAAIALARPASAPLKILLAEDNPINERVACGILKSAGHSVEVARAGSQVQPLLAAHHFDLILMDIQMPDMDGFEVTAAIREAEKKAGGHVPIIAMTAHAMEGYKERCLAGGMDGYLTKPIRRDLLLAALVFCQDLNSGLKHVEHDINDGQNSYAHQKP